MMSIPHLKEHAMPAVPPSVDDVLHYARGVLRATLAVLVVLAGGVLYLALSGQGRWLPLLSRLAQMAPLAIVLLIAVLQQRRRNLGADARSQAWQGMLNDEFRQHNLGRASRTALLAVLLLQMPLALLLDALVPTSPLVLQALLTMLGGAIVFLGSFLYFDRDGTA
jgi:hypothetical protein